MFFKSGDPIGLLKEIKQIIYFHDSVENWCTPFKIAINSCIQLSVDAQPLQRGSWKVQECAEEFIEQTSISNPAGVVWKLCHLVMHLDLR